MSMATPGIRKKLKPKYRSTIVCDHCNAEFLPGEWWNIAYTTGDTSVQFSVINQITQNACPICKKLCQAK